MPNKIKKKESLTNSKVTTQTIIKLNMVILQQDIWKLVFLFSSTDSNWRRSEKSREYSRHSSNSRTQNGYFTGSWYGDIPAIKWCQRCTILCPDNLRHDRSIILFKYLCNCSRYCPEYNSNYCNATDKDIWNETVAYCLGCWDDDFSGKIK